MSEEPAPPPQAVFEAAVDAEANARAVAAAAPLAQERADVAAVHTLPDALREPARALLASLADNKYLLGRRYAEWCTGAPKLESAVAAAAMAQDELGHARSFYPLLRGFGMTPHMDDKDWQRASTSAVACLDRPFAPVLSYRVGRRLSFLNYKLLRGLSSPAGGFSLLWDLARPLQFDIDWRDLKPTLREVRATWWDYRSLGQRGAPGPPRPAASAGAKS